MPCPPQPNYYTNKDGKSGNDYIKCCFVRDWTRHAAALSGAAAAGRPRFAGPVWGHVHMFEDTLAWFLG